MAMSPSSASAPRNLATRTVPPFTWWLLSCWAFSDVWKKDCIPIRLPRTELFSAWWENFRSTLLLESQMHSIKRRNKSKSDDLRRAGMIRLLRSREGAPAIFYFLCMHGLFLAFCFFTSGTLATAQVHVWEGTLKLPVYEEGAPDPTPPFDQFAVNRFNYPYTLRMEITNNRVEHDLRAIYLENEYLKCSVLPDIGGHVYTCVDKINGLPMFYANPSLKKAKIGYRGAWAAFGVEFNFPVSHNWVSMSPVDFAYGAHTDGSASITVSNIDRVYGIQWTVELALRPGSAVLEQHVAVNNR